MVYSLPKLSFAYDALEPFIDSKTMEIHYSKHHQAYLDKLNKTLENNPELAKKSAEELLKNIQDIPDEIRQAVVNFGGGFVNHNFFWRILAQKGQSCSGKIAKAIENKFGSFDNFKEAFSAKALTLFGSGWTWLVLNKSNLEIINTSNQDSPLSLGKIPILCLDVWEHAYYLKYQNKRAEYIEAFWNIINWKKVDEIYSSVMKVK